MRFLHFLRRGRCGTRMWRLAVFGAGFGIQTAYTLRKITVWIIAINDSSALMQGFVDTAQSAQFKNYICAAAYLHRHHLHDGAAALDLGALGVAQMRICQLCHPFCHLLHQHVLPRLTQCAHSGDQLSLSPAVLSCRDATTSWAISQPDFYPFEPCFSPSSAFRNAATSAVGTGLMALTPVNVISRAISTNFLSRRS